MNQKRFLPFAIALGAMAAWMLIAPHFFPPKKAADESAPATPTMAAAREAAMDRGVIAPAASGAATGAAPGGPVVHPASTAPATSKQATTQASAMGRKPAGQKEPASTPGFAAPEQWTLGSITGSKYQLQVVVSNVHAGVETVALNRRLYTADVQGKQTEFLLDAPESGYQSFATTSITINGTVYPLLTQSNGQPLTWTIDRAASNTDHVTFYLIFYQPDHPTQPWVRVDKTFTLESGGNYLVEESHRVENLSGAPVDVSIDQVGPTSLYNHPPDDFRMDNRAFQSAIFDKAKHYVNGSEKFERQVSMAGKPTPVPMGTFDYAGTDERLIWVASNKRFFTIIVRPLGTDTGDRTSMNRVVTQANFIGTVTAEPLVVNEKDPYDSLSALMLAGQSVRVPAHGKIGMPIELYMGPKDRHTFKGDISAPEGSFALTASVDRYIDLINFSEGGFCGFLTFTWLALAILWALQCIHYVVPNYGVAIILLVIVIRLCLHPLTRRGQATMARMQMKMAKAQPEIDRIKKKYAKDPATLRTEQMKVFKEYDVNPAGQVAGCAPMLVQTPIWIALYAGLQVDLDLRHAMFIPGWITDLANPDMVWGSYTHAVFTLPILGPIYGLNLLPLLLGVVFFINMRFQTKSVPKPADGQQAQVQKFSQFMILVIPLFLYNGSSGLNLYMFASTLGGIFDTWIVRKHLRKEGLLPARALAKT